MTKISIRFFNDREVRAVWDEEHSKWFFSAVDIVAVLNEQSDYTKNRNYWKFLKNKLKKDNPELVSKQLHCLPRQTLHIFTVAESSATTSQAAQPPSIPWAYHFFCSKAVSKN